MKKIILLSILFLLSSLISCQEEKKEVVVKKDKIRVVNPPQLDFLIEDSTSTVDLIKISKGTPNLIHGYGKGGNFTIKEIKRYSELKRSNHCFWAVANCTDEKIISQSQNANDLVFGASVPKIILATVAINNNGGSLKSNNDWKQLMQLLVVSANDPQWSYIQKLAGGSDSIKSFCKNWQYDMRPEKISGANMISALGMVKFYTDLCNRKFLGSDVILKISNACSTSGGRSKVFMPDSVIMGSKTGTWSQYIHDTGWFWWDGKYWSIAVLTDGWYSSEDIAIMWGGLFREYVVGNLQVNYSSQEKVVAKKSIKKKPRHKSKKKGKRKKK